jgi:hypothetical protein
MAPESQTLFSMTLFMALSSLLAWSKGRNRVGCPVQAPVAVAIVRGMIGEILSMVQWVTIPEA